MIILYTLFWAEMFTIFYTYFGYGIVAYIWLKIEGTKGDFRASTQSSTDDLPLICIVIAAFNEETIIGEKIRNTLELSYPAAKKRILLIADGSSDNTVKIASGFSNVEVLHQPERKGKSAAVNRAMLHIKEEIVVFCDANTMLNTEALLLIANAYADLEVGGVSGEKRVRTTAGKSATGAAEGLYWKYESFLKKLDSRLYSIVGAAGELFSLRRELFQELEEDTILDDFVLSLRINLKGYRIRYEPKAYAIEDPSFSFSDEKKRKVRIAAGGFQAMSRLKAVFNIARHPKLSFLYISHRVLRWTLCPIFVFMLPIVNLVLVIARPDTFYTFMLVIQFLFFAGAGIAGLFAAANRKIKGLYVCYYFLFMNWAVILGYFRFRKKSQSAIWEKARRYEST